MKRRRNKANDTLFNLKLFFHFSSLPKPKSFSCSLQTSTGVIFYICTNLSYCFALLFILATSDEDIYVIAKLDFGIEMLS